MESQSHITPTKSCSTSQVKTRRLPAGSPAKIRIYEDALMRQQQAFDEEDEDDVYMKEVRTSYPPIEKEVPPLDEELIERMEEEGAVAQDMQNLGQSFLGFQSKFKLMSKIGEGTFSTVYKAQDLQYDKFDNDWDYEEKENKSSRSLINGIRVTRSPRKEAPGKKHYVAIKKIYVTSSPYRIMNELELLHALRGCESIAPLITAFRHQDQVVAILPYFSHSDFRQYFRNMKIPDMRVYFRSLMTALASVHMAGIIHRDVKPTNFLYNPMRKRGVLVDFGLAEREGVDYQFDCLCRLSTSKRDQRLKNSYCAMNDDTRFGYPKEDHRPSHRANRAGTRGFRAPEVLFKCTAQTTSIDIWSVGVMLLTILTGRFPFFHSADDIDAVIELSTIFGKDWMKEAALLHGQLLQTNISTIGNGFSLQKVVRWCNNKKSTDRNGNKIVPSREEEEVYDFMTRCLDKHPRRRLTAIDALDHPFLATESNGSEDEMDHLSAC